MRLSPRLKSRRVLIPAALVLGAAAIIPACGGNSDGSFRTAQLESGDLSVTITATGTLEPEEVIDVGAQVAGLILGFGKDSEGKPIDYGSPVDEGTILAQIDPSLYISEVEQREAELARARADLLQFQAKNQQAERDWARAKKLGPSDALSQSAYDGFQSTYEAAKASVAVGDAQVTQAEAALAKAKRNLGYCTIKSPVKGVIIDKRVNVGQTVVSSLNAPSLFLIAQDLKRMEVWVSVNEADIANVVPGQKVTFTVDAFPGEEFVGEVNKVRLNASMTQNVVTYIVEVTTDNSSGRLLPYLTANAKFQVADSKNVLLAPNAALRWSPRAEVSDGAPSKAPEGRDAGVLWVPAGGKVKPVHVKTLGSDGVRTAVSGDGIHDGLVVAIGEKDASEGAAGSTGGASPFAPPMRRRGG